MSTKRDGRNLEATDELEALLLESGQQVSLDEIKFIDQQPEKARDLMKRWMHGQELWIAQLPQLLEEVHELAGDEGLDSAAQVLQHRVEKQHKDIQNSLIHCDVVDDQQTKQHILEGVQHLESAQHDMLEKLQLQYPQMKDALRKILMSQLLDVREGNQEKTSDVDH